MATTYEKIASVTVGSGGAADIEFTSIPATFDDLLIKLSARSSTTTGNITISLNNSTSSFSWRRLLGSGSSVSTNSGSDNYASAINLSSYTADTFGNWELYLPNYAGSTNKSFSIDAVTENNATGVLMVLSAHLWSNTAAITSIKLLADVNFVQHSTAVLYGIKKS